MEETGRSLVFLRGSQSARFERATDDDRKAIGSLRQIRGSANMLGSALRLTVIQHLDLGQFTAKMSKAGKTMGWLFTEGFCWKRAFCRRLPQFRSSPDEAFLPFHQYEIPAGPVLASQPVWKPQCKDRNGLDNKPIYRLEKQLKKRSQVVNKWKFDKVFVIFV